MGAVGDACIFAWMEPEGNEDVGIQVLVGFWCYILDYVLVILPLALTMPQG